MPSVTRILVPVDFSEPSAAAARYAQALARKVKGELILLHVLAVPQFSYLPITVTEDRIDELTTGRSRQAHEALLQFVTGDAGVPVKRFVATGDPTVEILQHSASEEVDLIVMPTHGFDPVRRFLLGSVALKVLHGAEVPVLTGVNFEAYGAEIFPPGYIVCGIDLGPGSERVLEWAAEVARKLGAPLTVVHAIPDIEGIVGDLSNPNWRLTLENRIRTRIAGLLEAANAKAEILVVTGDPHNALGETASRLKAGLVVIGRGATAEGPFGRLRAHAYAIVRASPCPVLSV